MSHNISVNPIFVFGSNQAGLHGAGAAKFAYRRKGAAMRIGEGKTGRAYALPTKDFNIKTLPLDVIRMKIRAFIRYAIQNPREDYQVTRIGCGLAGYTDAEIAPLFKGAPSCCFFDEKWKPYLGDDFNYLGSA